MNTNLPLRGLFARISLVSLVSLASLAAIGATACSAPVDGAVEAASTSDGETAGSTAAAQKIIYTDEHPNAVCEKNILGNVICMECSTGPFPSCTTYVCDGQGRNCKPTTRVIKVDPRSTLPTTTTTTTTTGAISN